jgi:enhancing lycopene biosynthesis protein 2
MDHVGGLLSLCRALDIKELWVNNLPEKKLWNSVIPRNETWEAEANSMIQALNIYTQALGLPELSHTRLRCISPLLGAGTLTVNLTGELTISCISADEQLCRRQDEIITMVLNYGLTGESIPEVRNALNELDHKINNLSLRLTLKYQGRVIVLPGDISAAYWLENPPEKCDIVKVPHHGFIDALSKSLLDILSPDYGIISVSNDRTDRPNEGILEQLRAYTEKYFFTDAVALPGGFGPSAKHSSVRVRIDGGKITIEEFVQP